MFDTGLLITVLVILSVVMLVGTLIVGRQENKKLAKYEQEGDSVEEQLKRSQEYETSSLKSNLPILAVIYGITLLASIIAILVYIFF